jgi:opacity protein-like surface antigen
MKKFVLMLALVAVLGSASAQMFSFGVKAGINTSTSVFKTGNLGVDNWQIIDTKEKVGFLAGVFARVTIASFYVQPEIYYGQSRSEITFQKIGETSVSSEINKMNTLNIPLLIGLKFGPFRINAGPVSTILLSSNNVVDNLTGLSRKMKNSSWGIQAGVGLDILKTITLDARYEGSFTKVGSLFNESTGSDLNFGRRPRQLIFTVGIIF